MLYTFNRHDSHRLVTASPAIAFQSAEHGDATPTASSSGRLTLVDITTSENGAR
jgi:hypothetical protein